MDLPSELWHKIFRNLDKRFLLQTATLVCKKWYHIVRNSRYICGYLRLPFPCEGIPIILQTCPALRTLELVLFEHERVGDAIFQYQDLIQNADNLEYLVFTILEKGQGFVIDQSKDFELTTSCFKMKKEYFSFSQNIAKIQPINVVLKATKPRTSHKVQKLCIEDFSLVTHFECRAPLMECEYIAKTLFADSKKLKILIVQFHDGDDEKVAEIIHEVLQNHPGLQCFWLAAPSHGDTLNIDQELFKKLLQVIEQYQENSSLQSMILENFPFVLPMGPKPKLKTIEYLRLLGSIDMENWLNIMEVFPNLKRLEFKDISIYGDISITPVQSLLYIDRLPNLRILNIEYPDDIECPKDCSDIVSVGKRTLHEDCEVAIKYVQGNWFSDKYFLKSKLNGDRYIKHHGPDIDFCRNIRHH